MNLLYITFGPRLEIHHQAAFSMLSFLAQKDHVNSITLITDAPEFYGHVRDHIELIAITPDTLKEWRGPHDFFWRIKIKALEHLALKLGEKPIVYLDTDTFLFGDGAVMARRLASQAFMHENEGELATLKTKTERRMSAQIVGKAFGGVTIRGNHAMWNAGVVAVPGAHNLKTIHMALSICDDMCAADVERRLVEQFALSVALAENYSLHAGAEFIGHYWGNKAGWNEVITKFFLENYLRNSPLEKELEALRAFDVFSEPVRTRRSSVHARWIRMVNEFYPPKGVVYVKQQPTDASIKNEG
jgi:hypothetical protein